jgi:hypothetical protein
MKQIILVAAIIAPLSACIRDPGSTGVSGMREATAAEVAQCRYISDIRSTPGTYGILASPGVRYARNRILADAQQAGANTVVFDPVSPGTEIYQLHAVAYSC